MYHPPLTDSPFASCKDYHEGKGDGKSVEKPVLIGTRDALKSYADDVDAHHIASRFYGRILRPEARGDEWTYKANEAFFAGVIEARRQVVVVSDIANDPHSRLFAGYTCDELFWLHDNGYQFQPYTKDSTKTVAIPPVIPQLLKIRHYDKNDRPCIVGNLA